MTNRAFKPPFDRLRRDRVNGGFSAKVSHQGQTISVRFDAEARDSLEQMLPTAHRFWRARVRWFKAYREYAVEELLPRLNSFLDSGEDNPPRVSPNRLRAILRTPFTIEFRQEDDGDEVVFELSGGDDDALQEHCLEAVGTLDAGFTDGDVVSLL